MSKKIKNNGLDQYDPKHILKCNHLASLSLKGLTHKIIIKIVQFLTELFEKKVDVFGTQCREACLRYLHAMMVNSVYRQCSSLNVMMRC